MGRKAFEGILDAVNLVIPVEVNSEATSMHDSGLAKMGRAVYAKENPFADGIATGTAGQKRERS
jgi:hypothetical protein